MFRRILLRTTPRPHLRSPHIRRHATDSKPSTSRVDRINRRLPRFLHRYTSALANAPLSHITSFLILHELTAIIPLFSLAAYFHYTHWLPPWFAEGAWVLNGVERFGRYFRRKGWIRSGEAEEAEREVLEIQAEEEMREKLELRKTGKAWKINEGGVRLVVEFATAYAITKALLVPRIMFSVWATPAFARWTVVPLTRRVGRIFGRRKEKGVKADGAGTRAVGGVIPHLLLRHWSAVCFDPANFGYSFAPDLLNTIATNKMCFDNRDTYTTRTYVRNGARVSEQYTVPRHGMSWRRRYGLGGPYYPSRYYYRPPNDCYMSNALVQSHRYSGYSGYPQRHSYPPYGGYPGYSGHSGYPRGVVPGGYMGQSSGYGRYYPGASIGMPRHAAMAYPKPRHQYVYTPRYGQRGFLSYAGQSANGAPYTGVIPNGGMAYGYGGVVGGVGVGVAAGGYYPGVRSYQSSYPQYGATYAPSYYPSYGYSSAYSGYSPAYSGYYNYNLYGSLYPFANFYHPYQRSYYNTVPSYGYATQAHVHPPGPTATTPTTTYHVTNSHANSAGYTARCEHRCPGTCDHGRTREDIQMESRRIATERGAYDPRRIRPSDARDNDPFWCRERNGEWHLRTYYQIEKECHPGRWMMDAELGYLVFHRS
ncbi:hypothetical protein EK21DRAFT_79370 [Setomelanomma holmii]|uniref:Uncharacterized protein n=1 Tax=Setomelanomma holmii TaxID=210430 RepID=A0A9P4GY52_9PLEO|nr:hypothetical protein EK21DRAFT_79370 [Setomelanomma holmii]